MEIAIVTLAAFVAGGGVCALVMRTIQLTERVRDLEGKLAGPHWGETQRLDLRAQQASVNALLALATRDTLDALMRADRHAVGRILRELGLMSIEEPWEEPKP